MTRKFPLVFTLSLGISFFLLLGFLGRGGYLHNQELKKEIEQKKYQTQVLGLQVESLSRQKKEALSQDALKDAAFKYGYQKEGEQVFYFSFDDQDADIPMQKQHIMVETKYFTGIRPIYIFSIALAISTLITVCFYLIEKKRKGKGT